MNIEQKLDEILTRLERLEQRQVRGLERIEKQQEEIKENTPVVGSFTGMYEKKD
jgi:hypothetical protein